jgi:GLPGLI family protein
MKMLYTTFAILLLSANVMFAQHAHFATSGSIDYEKSVNMYALITKLYGKDMEGFQQTAFDNYKKTQPQFKILKSTLTFSGSQTVFTPIAQETVASGWFNLPMTDQNSIVYSDMNTHNTISQKTVFDETFLVKDSLQKIKWKITGETRDIAGYTCRRANGLLLDSVYVVAFYTEKIPVPGGPELFSGLPGMILEVALPHENISWRAVKVTDMTVPPAALAPPKKGKPVTHKQLYDTLLGVFKTQGDPRQVNFVIKQYMF